MKAQTQAAQVLEYIRRFYSISTFEAFTELGVTRLGARVFDLRRDGYNIEGETVSKQNRLGKTVHYKVYRRADSERSGTHHSSTGAGGTDFL